MNMRFVTAPIATEFRDLEEIESCLSEPAVSGPQLGILSLASVLENCGHEVSIVEADRLYLNYLREADRSIPFAQAAGRLIAAQPADVYGFGSICSSYPLTLRIAEIVKACRPDASILLGGPQATVVDGPTLTAFPFIDYILRGEAELALPLFLQQLAGEREFARVPSLSYRVESQVVRNASAPVIEDLDCIPVPAYHLVGGLQGENRASLELGRGCPFACTFCSTNDFFRRRFRLRSPQKVLSEMKRLSEMYGVREFELVHDMFTIDRKRVAAFCDTMLASGDDFSWSCSARTDCVDEELLALMARAGCVSIFYGVEAGSARLQKIIDKHLDIERARQVVDETERLGMRCTVSLITGFPEETEDDLRQTLRMYLFSARHPQSLPQLNVLAPLAGTPIQTIYKDQLTLGELCSEMSQQGVSQDEDDFRWIQKYPEIFPNFYLLPTLHLDRSCLLELREFALNAFGHFRWLLCGVDRTQNFYDFFLNWRQYRMELQPSKSGAELRNYYKSRSFRKDVLRFVSLGSAAGDKAVQVLLEFENAWETACEVPRHAPYIKEPGSNHSIIKNKHPRRAPGTQVIETSRNVQAAIEDIKGGRDADLAPGAHFYVTLPSPAPLKKIYSISRELGRVLQVSDGTRSLEDIVALVSNETTDIKESIRDAVIFGLIESAVESGLLILDEPPERARSAGNFESSAGAETTADRA